MTRVLFIILANLLFITHTYSQAKMSIDNETFDFGEVEWKQPGKAHFNITNAGDKPLVINEVIPDCACSAAQWTTAAIAPGDKGVIEVVFDAKALGSFHKSIAILSNAEELKYIHFKGKVVEKLKDYSKTHPYVIDGLRIDKQEIVFRDATKGERPTFEMSIVNQSNKAYEPVIMHLPAYIEREATPSLLEHGDRGHITLTLNTELLSNVGLNESTVYLSRFTGDKVSEENAIPLSAILLPDFSTLSDAEKSKAPRLDISMKKGSISQTLATKGSAKCDITLTNTGASTLKIMNVQVIGSGATVSLKKSTLQPKQSARLRVTLNKKTLNKQENQIKVLLITNNPNQPKTEININY